MFGNNGEQEATRSIFVSSVKGLANTGAVAAAFFVTPIIYDSSVGFIRTFTEKHYGSGFADLTDFAWFVIIAVLSFFTARASVATLILMGGLAVTNKLF